MENMRKTKLLPRKRRMKEKFRFWCNEHKHYWYSDEPGGFVPSKPKEYPFPCKKFWSDGWLEDKEGFRYPTRKWLDNFRKLVNQLSKNI